MFKIHHGRPSSARWMELHLVNSYIDFPAYSWWQWASYLTINWVSVAQLCYILCLLIRPLYKNNSCTYKSYFISKNWGHIISCDRHQQFFYPCILFFSLEGGRGFYKGLFPSLLRVTPACCITFLVYEHLTRILKTSWTTRSIVYSLARTIPQ